MDFLILFVGDLVIAHRTGVDIAPPAIHFSAARFAMELALLENRDAVIELIREKLAQLNPGRADAYRFEILVFHILSLLFVPPLSAPRFQVATSDRFGRKDITFANLAVDGFWGLLRENHGNVIMCFEVKNKTSLQNDDVNQLSSRLSPLTGQAGFIVLREVNLVDRNRSRHSLPKGELILPLCDRNLIEACTAYEWRGDASQPLAHIYRGMVDDVV